MKIEDLHFDFPNRPVDEENWDLETWRKNQPMDYYKAIYMLQQTTDINEQNILFRAIYKVTRLYIPDVLYKYFSLSDNEASNEKKFRTLSAGKIYMSDIKDFNDPFDAKNYFSDSSKLMDIEWLKPHGGKLIDDFNSYIKATSLTANGTQSMPMWAHYANNHAGFCVSYDMNANLSLRSNTFPIQYTDDRLDITSFMHKQAQKIGSICDQQRAAGRKIIELSDLSVIYIHLLLCNIKQTAWSYENEYRCTTSARTPGMPYIEAKPHALYLGKNCALSHTQRLIEIARQWKIPVYKMDFDDCSSNYSLIIKPFNDAQ